MKWSDIIGESKEGFETNLDENMGDHMILGNTVPVWDGVDYQDAAVFKSSDKSVEVFFRDGEYEVWNGPKMIYQTDSADSLEAKLTKYKLTKFDGIHLFSQSKEKVIERSANPLPKTPQWDQGLAKVAGHMVPNWSVPTEHDKVAFFQGRDGNHAEVYVEEGLFYVALPFEDFTVFDKAREADRFLSTNNFGEYQGWSA